MEVLDYERLVADFEVKLLTQLRNFGSDAEYLETWVPDEDPVKSILNMVEAAEAAGRSELAVRIAASTMPPDRVRDLAAEIGSLGRIDVSASADKVVITVSGIGLQ
ncbi:MAG TPA: hypothetical protein VKX28_02715 [Xanthobacteraceae bacterium]|nr:hypothetical protein [Xanthobacteraceae bacterium]